MDTDRWGDIESRYNSHATAAAATAQRNFKRPRVRDACVVKLHLIFAVDGKRARDVGRWHIADLAIAVAMVDSWQSWQALERVRTRWNPIMRLTRAHRRRQDRYKYWC